jgi:hypothetical protein
MGREKNGIRKEEWGKEGERRKRALDWERGQEKRRRMRRCR